MIHVLIRALVRDSPEDASAFYDSVQPPVIPAQAGIQPLNPPTSGCRIKSGMTRACREASSAGRPLGVGVQVVEDEAALGFG